MPDIEVFHSVQRKACDRVVAARQAADALRDARPRVMGSTVGCGRKCTIVGVPYGSSLFAKSVNIP